MNVLSKWFGGDISSRITMAGPVAIVSALLLTWLLAAPMGAWMSTWAGATVATAVSWALLVAPFVVVSLLWYGAMKELAQMALIKGRWTFPLIIQTMILTVGLGSLAVCVYVSWQWFLTLLIGTYAVDTLALGVGRTYAKWTGCETHRLPFGLQRLSPNKTIEGFLGGMVAGWIVAGLVMWLLVATAGMVTPWYGLLIVLLMPFTAFAGDVYESWIKRDVGIKDAGDILGAHGGLLDRIDSICAVFVTALPLLIP